ncbi:acetoacetate metabolism regulatory protein AtoC [mine drainage metagenome]|uniref:Acetoacetate metabolism regulatory protein AtoC n=1 Tax=mine drainage metagenome TaxID=410659 RepID=A0A1J5RGF2_9ZZZZ
MTPRIRVMVGDGELRRRLLEWLRGQGYGAVADQAAGAVSPVDLAVLDAGLAEAAALGAALAGTCPLIVLSQSATAAPLQGAAAVLRQPVDFDELALAVARTLELAALRRENQQLHQRLAATPVIFQAEPSLEAIKRDYLRYLLAKYGGHRGKVARILGISERNTYRLIGKFGFGEGGGAG